MKLAIDVSWALFLCSLVWLLWEGATIGRDRRLMPVKQRKQWPLAASPWRFANWPSLDRILLALAGLLGVLSFAPAFSILVPVAYWLATIVALRLGLRAHAWWKGAKEVTSAS